MPGASHYVYCCEESYSIAGLDSIQRLNRMVMRASSKRKKASPWLASCCEKNHRTTKELLAKSLQTVPFRSSEVVLGLGPPL